MGAAIIGALIGGAQAGAGYIGAQSRARNGRDLIKRAYKVNERDLNIAHADQQQSLSEDLVRRGLLSSASGGSPTMTPPTDLHVDPSKVRGGLGGGVLAAYGANKRNPGFYAEAQRNAAGVAANTLGAQKVNDQTTAAYRENQDLWNQRDAAIAGVNAQAGNEELGAIAGGVQSGLNLYDAYSQSIPGAAGKTDNVSQHFAYGIDPVSMQPLKSAGAPSGATIADPYGDIANFRVNK